MKALTLQNPWAWAVFHAGKNLENRWRPTSYRGPLLIHVGKSRQGLERFLPGELLCPGCPPLPDFSQLVFRAVLGVVEVVDCLKVKECEDNPWAVGPYCWVLENPRLLKEPLPFSGQQAFFDVPDHLLADLL